ncbi:MAG: hypothetical protein IPJ46_21780 [Anaerolineales bacterium]|nr:hypothetical protein [Anaerolineales bacterium]
MAKFDSTRLETKEIPREEKKPENWMDLSIANKPVTFTYALIALALAVVKFFCEDNGGIMLKRLK